MSKHLIIINTTITLTLLLIVLFLIFYTTNLIKRTKKYILTIGKTFIPDFIKIKYTIINYPKNIPIITLDKFIKSGSKDLSINYVNDSITFITACMMSSYNINFGYPHKFPNYINFIKKIGDCGYYFSCGKYSILCFRGSTSTKDLITDIDSAQVPFIDVDGNSYYDLKVHRGFHSMYLSVISSLREIIFKKHLIIIGHSLGGTVSSLISLAVKLKTGSSPKTITFGCPKIGNRNLVNTINSLNIINKNDIITQLPPSVLYMEGENCLYSSHRNIKHIDIQTGNTFKNHSLMAYSYGISGNFISDNKFDILWK